MSTGNTTAQQSWSFFPITISSPKEDLEIQCRSNIVTVGDCETSGKSRATLELLALAIDFDAIVADMTNRNHVWTNEQEFCQLYFGPLYPAFNKHFGLQTIVRIDNTEFDLAHALQSICQQKTSQESRCTTNKRKTLVVPEQRYLALNRDITHPYSSRPYWESYQLRYFCHLIHNFISSQSEGTYLPSNHVLGTASLQDMFKDLVLEGKHLYIGSSEYLPNVKTIYLMDEQGNKEPFSGWSLSQAVIIPLILAIDSATAKRKTSTLEWILIENPFAEAHTPYLSMFIGHLVHHLAKDYIVAV